jgi:LPXTG-motif cell wall-anchored protein
MLPGQATVIQNDEVTPVDIFFDDFKALNVRGQDFQLRLTGDCSSGCSVVSETTGREVLLLRRDGNALFDGFGFMPGTLVHFWIFSEPVYLGSLVVAPDGTFDGSLFLTGIDPGEHTLQLNGTSFDGQDRSANLGVIVTTDADPLPALPATGSNRSNELMLLGVSLAMLGFIITVRRRA